MRRADLSHAVRQQLQRLPEPFAAHYGVVPQPPPEHALSLGEALLRQQAASEALARIDALASEVADPYLISRVLPRREAVSSSAIEGTNSTLDELLAVEETGDRHASEAAKQVRDYAIALEDLVPRARVQGRSLFVRPLVEELHRTVMRGDRYYPDAPGTLRSAVVWIGGGRDIAYSTFNPPPPCAVPRCLEDALAYMRCEGMHAMTQSLITRMAVAHAHFEAVHPFRDGNGRVGRLLLPLMMAADGRAPLYLSPFIEAHKSAYHEALKAAQQRLGWEAIVAFVADAILGTVSELIVTRDALRGLRAIWERRQKLRRGSAAGRALDLFPHYPVVTIRRLATLLGVSVPAAAAAIEQLTRIGVVIERTGYRRNRVFVAQEALSIINRPYAAVPVLPGVE